LNLFEPTGRLKNAVKVDKARRQILKEKFHHFFIKLSLSFQLAFHEKCTAILKFFLTPFLIPKFLSLLLDLPSGSSGTPANPSRHTGVPQHTVAGRLRQTRDTMVRVSAEIRPDRLSQTISDSYARLGRYRDELNGRGSIPARSKNFTILHNARLFTNYN
jgi:hypothetical protein